MTKTTEQFIPLHHTVAKRAQKHGITFAFDTKPALWVARHTASNRTWRDYNGKTALDNLLLALSTEAAMPLVRVQQVLKDGKPFDIAAVYAKARSEVIAQDPDMADLIATLKEMDESGEIEENRPTTSGGVVPDIYKKRYAANGDPTTCGDWLALLMNQHCQTLDEKGKTVTDLDRVEAIAVANGVEAARVDRLGTQTNGWQGRYRMTVRNMLTKVVAAKGYCLIPEGIASSDTEEQAPAEWMAKHAPKPKETGTTRKSSKAPEPEAATEIEDNLGAAGIELSIS